MCLMDFDRIRLVLTPSDLAQHLFLLMLSPQPNVPNEFGSEQIGAHTIFSDPMGVSGNLPSVIESTNSFFFNFIFFFIFPPLFPLIVLVPVLIKKVPKKRDKC